ncbi:MAG: STAS domain-containing protein [Oxalobacteraceae bacterium]|nr:STAS domain-containing protein [Oxalobacteraceae bacterium]
MPFAPTTLTMNEAETVLAEGLQAIAAGDTQIDLGALQHFDSAAIATLLAWQRASSNLGKTLHITQLPQGLGSLAKLYGVEPLLLR